MTVSYRVPSYIALPGVHALYYGKPALIIADSLGLTFRLTKSSKNVLRDKKIQIISSMVLDYLSSQKTKYKSCGFEWNVEKENPYIDESTYASCLCVAATAAFLKLYTGKDYDPVSINRISYQFLKKLNPLSVGFETSICTFGGLIYFRREFEFLKNVSQLSFKLPDSIEKNLYIVDTGKAEEDAHQMISKVGQDYNKRPKIIGSIFNELETVAKKLIVSTIKEDRRFLISNLREAQLLVEKLNIISDNTKNLVHGLNSIGASILIGCGGLKNGSGPILVYTEDSKKLGIISQKHKLKCIKFKQTTQGIT